MQDLLDLSMNFLAIYPHLGAHLLLRQGQAGRRKSFRVDSSCCEDLLLAKIVHTHDFCLDKRQIRKSGHQSHCMQPLRQT